MKNWLKLDRWLVPWEVWKYRFAIRFSKLPDEYLFLKDAAGVIHVGANLGQERYLYRRLGIPVIWIEPIPDIFKQLQQNIVNFPEQSAYQQLFTDVDGKDYEFQVASNNGASSSIFQFKNHKELWPEVELVKSIQLQSLTMASFIKKENIDLSRYDALILDTQGAELLVLQGAGELLRQFKKIKLEASTFELYKGACVLQDIEAFLKPYGFKEVSRYTFAVNAVGGQCCDVIYRRED